MIIWFLEYANRNLVYIETTLKINLFLSHILSYLHAKYARAIAVVCLFKHMMSLLSHYRLYRPPDCIVREEIEGLLSLSKVRLYFYGGLLHSNAGHKVLLTRR